MLDLALLGLALLCLACALLPAILAAMNLTLLRTPEAETRAPGLISILIPARNEEANIEATLRAALASAGTAIEILVGDDHSTDRTAAIVRGLAAEDARLRLVCVPSLPEGWTGKNHACAHLADAARGEHLLFIDADVRLEPNAAAGLAAHARRTGAALVSGVPRQRMPTLGERLTVPMINFLLVGFLPVAMMRASARPTLGAACGQLVLILRAVYAETGGHAAIRTSLHDGVHLPRVLRAKGHRTDLVAGQALATCRMYRSFAEAWAGFSKNAHEGMATPRALPVWTLLLLLGQVLPFLLVLAGLFGLLPGHTLAAALAALIIALSTRAAITLVVNEPVATIPLHPLTVLTALAIQWNVLLRQERAGAATWKGRSYPVGDA
ncbi:glycosyltransferase [Methylobacterium soli]|uniref:Glycosyltransferase n=1 Tax=Methylobacterium soli TaxID=553447 RepID=A0A6L3SU97_9HYPH|nr:glycosyltransferase family A protein [Methylobacterium soli]KAB1077042.1 glycosyltransferase [Methylobacterium soli]GJE41703.1 Undecaprenyl-phosphate 4-deoxy-4-formamido-L-arabinose transferase [Methylobacterium soli]